MLKSRPLMFLLLLVQVVIVGFVLLYTMSTETNHFLYFERQEPEFPTLPPNFDPFRKVTIPGLDHKNVTRYNQTGQGINSTERTPVMMDKAIGIHSFPSLPSLFPVPRQNSKKVPRLISDTEYATLMRLVNLSMSVLDAHNISYTLAYGSLIGSYLMHDMLPWDDDVDIFVHNDTKAKVMDLFKDDRHFGIRGHHHYRHNGRLFKLFFSSSKSAGKYPWNWPFIDIVTYIDVDKDHLKAVQAKANLIWPKDSFFPNHLRPFGPLWLPVPRHPWVFLTAKYVRFRCQSSKWSHKGETGQKIRTGNCKELAHTYPFVKRTPVANITYETLVLNGQELYGIFINEPYRKQKTMFGW